MNHATHNTKMQINFAGHRFFYVESEDFIPDAFGVLLILDQTDEGLFAIGTRPADSLWADAYCESMNPEWQKRRKGTLRFAHCMIPHQNEAAMYEVVRSAVIELIDTNRRREPVPVHAAPYEGDR